MHACPDSFKSQHAALAVELYAIMHVLLIVYMSVAGDWARRQAGWIYVGGETWRERAPTIVWVHTSYHVRPKMRVFNFSLVSLMFCLCLPILLNSPREIIIVFLMTYLVPDGHVRIGISV